MPSLQAGAALVPRGRWHQGCSSSAVGSSHGYSCCFSYHCFSSPGLRGTHRLLPQAKISCFLWQRPCFCSSPCQGWHQPRLEWLLGARDARGGDAGLCWELLSRLGVLHQRTISSNNTEFKMELGAFLCPCSIRQRSQLGAVLGPSPGVLRSQTSLEGEFLGWVSPSPGSSLPSCRAVQAEARSAG